MRFFAFVVGIAFGWTLCFLSYMPYRLEGKWYYYDWKLKSGVLDKIVTMPIGEDFIKALNESGKVSTADVEAYRVLIEENVLEKLEEESKRVVEKLKKRLRFIPNRLIVLRER